MALHWSSSADRNLGIGKCCCKVFYRSAGDLDVVFLEDSCERFRDAFDVGKDINSIDIRFGHFIHNVIYQIKSKLIKSPILQS